MDKYFEIKEKLIEIAKETFNQNDIVKFGVNDVLNDFLTEMGEVFAWAEEPLRQLRFIGEAWVKDIEDAIEERKFDFFDTTTVLFLISSDGALYLGTVIVLAGGGPSLWLDTRDRKVFVNSDTTRVHVSIPSEICNEIDNYFAEKWNASRKGREV